MTKLKDIHPQRKLEKAYEALFESHLCNADIVWNAISDAVLSLVQELKIRARKLIEYAKYKDGWTGIGWIRSFNLLRSRSHDV